MPAWDSGAAASAAALPESAVAGAAQPLAASRGREPVGPHLSSQRAPGSGASPGRQLSGPSLGVGNGSAPVAGASALGEAGPPILIASRLDHRQHTGTGSWDLPASAATDSISGGGAPGCYSAPSASAGAAAQARQFAWLSGGAGNADGSRSLADRTPSIPGAGAGFGA